MEYVKSCDLCKDNLDLFKWLLIVPNNVILKSGLSLTIEKFLYILCDYWIGDRNR
jgi:hypothetical protein